jgi:hypothetical protein
MNDTSSKWWWLPGALLALAGLLFMVAAADSGRPGVWVPIGLVFLVLGGDEPSPPSPTLVKHALIGAGLLF